MNQQSSDPSPRQQPAINFRWLQATIIVIAFVVIGGIAWFAWTKMVNGINGDEQEKSYYSDEHLRILKLIESLKGRRPANVSKIQWSNGIIWTNTVHHEVFHSEPTTFAALPRYRKDLEEKLHGNIDLSIFEWIWDRFAETGLHGKRCTDNGRQLLRDSLQPDAEEWVVD